MPPPPSPLLLKRAAGTAWILLGCGVAASTVAYTVAAHSPVQVADRWDEIMWLERWFAGDAGISGLWRLHNEHSLLFPRLLILADLL